MIMPLNFQGEKFLRSIKNESDEVKDNSEGGTPYLSSTYFVYENANLSMKGGKFFNVSYGFMGAVKTFILIVYNIICKLTYCRPLAL